jgi:hypothetical protein
MTKVFLIFFYGTTPHTYTLRLAVNTPARNSWRCFAQMLTPPTLISLTLSGLLYDTSTAKKEIFREKKHDDPTIFSNLN